MIGGHRVAARQLVQGHAASPARVSFVNADSLDGGDLQQRHARDPERPHGQADQVPRGRHRLVQHYLFVAETDVGVRVFDTNYILGAAKLPPTADLNAPYVLPQVGYYKQAKGAGLTFSFVETDRSSPALITGKYADKARNRRIVRWPLDPASGLPALQANGAWKMPASNVQGGLMHKGRLLASSSYKPGRSAASASSSPGTRTSPPRTGPGRTARRTCTTRAPATACTRSPRRRTTGSCSPSTAPRSV